MVLLEEMAFDARGNPTAATYKDYLLPAISDIPDFEFLHANTPSKSVGGMRGVGEGGAIIGPPTLVNAIADALAPFGEVPVELPLTPAKLLRVIEGRTIAGAPAESRIDGDWNMVLATPMGPQEMRGHFETDGGSLSGYLSSPAGRESFAGTVEGNRLKFDLKVEKPMKITLKYDVAVEGDKLTGKVKMGIFGSAKLSGERVRVTQNA
jgi:carbon-monoxide dehydrogenase large subunit